MATGFRTRADHLASPQPLPAGRYVGLVLVESDGTQLESIWDGRDGLSADPWPEGPAKSLRTIGALRGAVR